MCSSDLNHEESWNLDERTFDKQKPLDITKNKPEEKKKRNRNEEDREKQKRNSQRSSNQRSSNQSSGFGGAAGGMQQMRR